MFNMTAFQLVQVLKKLQESLSIDSNFITNKVPGAGTITM